MFRILALIASVLGLLAALPAAASATSFYLHPRGGDITHTRPSSCPTWRLCVYKDDNFRGTKSIRREKDNPYWPWSHFENGENMNDKASSVFNSSPVRVKRLFRNSHYGPYVICLAPNTGIKDLYAVRFIEWVGPYPVTDASMEDRISSHSSHSESIDNLYCNWRVR
jgi:hypothetical protein